MDYLSVTKSIHLILFTKYTLVIFFRFFCLTFVLNRIKLNNSMLEALSYSADCRLVGRVAIRQ